MLNLFQHPSCIQAPAPEAKWMLKQVQHDEKIAVKAALFDRKT